MNYNWTNLMQQPYSDHESTTEEQVTTEPQRLALEAMSKELVDKLHAMVEEQQQRARVFAEQQHSLSSLPSTHTPAVPSAPVHAAPPVVEAYDYHQQEYEYSNLPPLPPIPPAPRAAYTPKPTPPPVSKPRKPAKVVREQQDETEGNIGAGTIIFILAVVFIIFSRGCS